MPLETWIILGWVFVLLWVPFVILTNRKEQPAVLFWLFMVELWERFSYYGMRAFLVLYLTKSLVTGGFGLPKEVGFGIYAAYGALVYLTPLAGGYLADRILGFRKAIIWGAILMAAGQFTLFTSPGTDLIPPGQYKERAEQWAKERGHKATLDQLAERQAGDDGLDAEAFKKAVEKRQEEFTAAEMKLMDEQIAGSRASEKGTEWLLFGGLTLLVIGNGFFKPNISSMIGRFYPQGDPRRDRAFTIFYMGINTGAFIAPLTCGYVADSYGWRYGFLLAGCGMVAGLIIFLFASYRGILQNYADPPRPDGAGGPDIGIPGAGEGDRPVNMAAGEPGDVAEVPRPGTRPPARSGLPVYLGTLLAVPLVALLIWQNTVVDIILGVIGAAVVAYMLYLSFRYPVVERQRIWVIVVLLFFTTVFWGFFELAGSALNVFTDENVDKRVFGSEIPASVFQAVNALFIMLFAPVFTLLWGFLAKKNLEPNAAVKFASGLLLLGLGFLVLNVGKGAAVGGIMPLIFLILLYLFHTLGELALSPVGLSLVTKLAPAKIVGFMMGFWFLSSAIAHQAGKFIAGAMAVDSNAPAEVRLDKSIEVFNLVGLFAVGSGVLLLVLSPVLKKWMHGVK